MMVEKRLVVGQFVGGSGIKKFVFGLINIVVQGQVDQLIVMLVDIVIFVVIVDGDGNDIVVMGIWQLLVNVQLFKCNVDMVVDVIIVEDIGVLFDCLINEVLQCVLGVVIMCFVFVVDVQYFFVEGLSVQICGFIYLCGEFNGCDVFVVSFGCEIGYNDVFVELVGLIEVFKNLIVDLIEGGIFGMVSINMCKFFDSKDMFFYLLGGVSYGDFVE